MWTVTVNNMVLGSFDSDEQARDWMDEHGGNEEYELEYWGENV